jgi:hypothetical protein
MAASDMSRLTTAELLAEGGTLLPSKEVLSLLDLAVDVDLALDFVAPIDLAVAGNLNIAAPITGAVSANVLSLLSTSAAATEQGVMIDQGITGEAIATAPQTTVVDQSNDVVDDGGAGTAVDAGAVDSGLTVTDPVTGEETEIGSLLDGDLLNIDVNVAVDADLAAPIAGAVALNGNVAAPIDAAVSANVGSVGSESIAVANQQAIITQDLDGVIAEATATQDADITQ